MDFDDNFPPRYVKIEIDLNNHEDIVEFVIHELMHVTLSELARGKFDENLEEVFVLSLSSYISGWVMKSPQRSKRWTKLINQKLVEAAKALEPIPLEERVVR